MVILVRVSYFDIGILQKWNEVFVVNAVFAGQGGVYLHDLAEEGLQHVFDLRPAAECGLVLPLLLQDGIQNVLNGDFGVQVDVVLLDEHVQAGGVSADHALGELELSVGPRQTLGSGVGVHSVA
eukprot:CAMPEP_0116897890 /NCGR_PEP_ID=MMETSP0467-20121206/6741_1 /TAXON_ID=283647 /ORGANISM="Mesodinium pulex, Strain SPMC105" /LENGTH=123 /DNA_ID=CAMNT_0004569727 /DNA_START=144 /DNA_END=515 /DNA_ORIENTATION=-